MIDFLKKHPLQVGYLYAHGNGLTPETLVKRLLQKHTTPKVYDEYALPKVRVTKKMIAEFRKQLEQEYRKFLPNDVFGEAFIQNRCYGVDDDYIRNALERHQTDSGRCRLLGNLIATMENNCLSPSS